MKVKTLQFINELEFFKGLKLSNIYLAFFLSLLDIKLKYRRSFLGPIWISLTTGVLILSISLIFGKYLEIKIENLIPHISLGIIFWFFIVNTIQDSSTCFSDSERLIKQVRIPYIVFILRVIFRNLINLLHNSIIIFIVIFIYFESLNISVLSFFIGFILLFINLFWIAILVSIANIRFRDIGPLIQNLMQVLFYLTPIIWASSSIKSSVLIDFILKFNIFNHFINLVRYPLINGSLFYESFFICLFTGFIGLFISLIIFEKCKNNIVIWL